jgi:transcription elongation factor GreB
VGVDEADISKGKISFISPIAILLIDKSGRQSHIKISIKADRVLEIMEITY